MYISALKSDASNYQCIFEKKRFVCIPGNPIPTISGESPFSALFFWNCFPFWEFKNVLPIPQRKTFVILNRVSKHLHKLRLDQLVQLGKLLFAQLCQTIDFVQSPYNNLLFWQGRQFNFNIKKVRFCKAWYRNRCVKLFKIKLFTKVVEIFRETLI